MKVRDKNYFCSVGDMDGTGLDFIGLDGNSRCEHSCEGCIAYHRKWPTPEQFEMEYCRKPDNGQAVYAHKDVWFCIDYLWASTHQDIVGIDSIIIACTPFGKPPDNRGME